MYIQVSRLYYTCRNVYFFFSEFIQDQLLKNKVRKILVQNELEELKVFSKKIFLKKKRKMKHNKN